MGLFVSNDLMSVQSYSLPLRGNAQLCLLIAAHAASNLFHRSSASSGNCSNLISVTGHRLREALAATNMTRLLFDEVGKIGFSKLPEVAIKWPPETQPGKATQHAVSVNFRNRVALIPDASKLGQHATRFGAWFANQLEEPT